MTYYNAKKIGFFVPAMNAGFSFLGTFILFIDHFVRD